MKRLIGLGGLAEAGKDAVADRMVEEHGYVKVGMSDALLEHALILDPFIPINLHNETGPIVSGDFARLSTIVEAVGYVEAKKNPEVRRFLQADGTEGGRNFHHENIWVDRMGAVVDRHLKDGKLVVVTGIRYLNELRMILSFGGYSVWVERPSLGAPTAASHSSEASLSSGYFGQVIDNNGTLEELHDSVDWYLR